MHVWVITTSDGFLEVFREKEDASNHLKMIAKARKVEPKIIQADEFGIILTILGRLYAVKKRLVR